MYESARGFIERRGGGGKRDQKRIVNNPILLYVGVMEIDETRIAEALRATFDPRADRAVFIIDAREVLGMLHRKESREALIQRLAAVQLRISQIVFHDDCARLADKLLDAVVSAT